jgi:hypothetical protein
MRRFAVLAAVLAVIAAVGFAYAASSGALPVLAITATPSHTPTPTPVGPSIFVVSTITNPGPAADNVDIVTGGFISVSLTADAPGCAAPILTITPLPPFLVTPPVPPLSFARSNIHITWPAACVDPGESIELTFEISSVILNVLPEIQEAIFPTPGATFYDSAVGTATASATPTITPTFTATPDPGTREIALDCDATSGGVQNACSFAPGTTTIDVHIVFRNNTVATDVAAAQANVHNPDTTRLDPPVVTDPTGQDSNPDFNQTALTGPWDCSLLLPDNDTGTDGPGTSVSKFGCFMTGPPAGVPVAANGELVLATVRYDVPPGALPGTVALTLSDAVVGDDIGNSLVACVEFGPVGSCSGATITLLPATPTATPTPTSTSSTTPTPTDTPTPTATLPGPSIVKIPEGNANNVDLSIPAANLWICQTGPCSGPGEGSLIVFEYASNVQTGDFDGDTVTDGLGAYEFSVEFSRFVIYSVNPVDAVFAPLGSMFPYPGGADGVTDGEGDARAPANCSFSLILEGLVHFGCVTGGQAPGPTGDFDLARLELFPYPSLTASIYPGNDNGIVTVVKDNGCELVDVFGHPVIGSVGGGLTPVCGDLAVTVRILEGDLNLDCEVDVSDQQMISYRYGAFFGSLLYFKWFDLEPSRHDRDIDIKDIQKVWGRDGSTCQVPIQPQPPLPPPVPFGN